jgi:chromosome partitioning protein
MVAIAIANQKGGVGKTTVTLGIAEVAADLGLKVLVVDCDPQANCTAGFGIDLDNESLSLAEILADEIQINADNFSDYIHTSSWASGKNSQIKVICSSHSLAKVESLLASDPIGSCDRLERALEQVKNQFDLILFDCPPSVGLLTINALFASDEVLIVSAPSAWSSDGVESFNQNVLRIASRRQGKPSISGIVVNNVGRTRDGKFWESDLVEKYKDAVISVSSRAAIAEASAMSSPISELGSRPGAKEAYNEFREVFLKFIGLQVEELNPSVSTELISSAV